MIHKNQNGEALWFSKIQGKQIPVSLMSQVHLSNALRTVRGWSPWSFERDSWINILSGEMDRRSQLPVQTAGGLANLVVQTPVMPTPIQELCFSLEQIIKKKQKEEEERYYHTAPTGWRGFILEMGNIERIISVDGNRQIFERVSGLHLKGANDVSWHDTEMVATCYGNRETCLEHLEERFPSCKCGLYGYFNSDNIQLREFPIVGKAVGWGKVAWAQDGFKASDMSLEALYMVAECFRYNRFDVTRDYIDFGRMAKDLAATYDNKIPVFVVETHTEIGNGEDS